jgi:hypothetical protein
MQKLLRGLRPSPALIVACLALFVAMGGVGYAAIKLKPNSVKTKNLKNGAVKEAKIADGAVSTPKLAPNAVSTDKIQDDAVTGPKVKDGSLTPADVSGSLTLVAKGELAPPGLLAAGACSVDIAAPAPGAKDGDTVVITSPTAVTTLATSFSARVATDKVHYVACNLSGANQNYGSVAPTEHFVVLR